MSSIEKYITKIKKKLSSSDLEEGKILKYLRHLDSLEVNVEILKNTGIGKFVNGLKKQEGLIGDAANNLVLKWKTTVTKQQDDSVSLHESSLSPKSSKISLLNSEVDKQTVERTNERERERDRTNKHHNKDNRKKDDSKSKPKAPGLQLCDISFGCEITSKDVTRQKKKQKLNTPSSSSSTRENHRSYNSHSDYSNTNSYLPPLPTAASVNQALLPDIQPSYKPSRLPLFDDSPSKKKKGADIEGTYVGEIKSRKSKTQVFSGRRNPGSFGVVPALFDSCIRVLVENIEALHETGGVPYYILQPVLQKCTPQQLLHLEECNPDIIEDSDELWLGHYRREFRAERQISGLSWRESYLEKCKEREDRLKKINAKISASQAAKKPERQVKLAYLETIAKPPPQVRRKQARFGTAHGTEVPSNAISPIKHKSSSSPRPSHISNPFRQSHTSTAPAAQPAMASSAMAAPKRPASAPLLKKTMKMFKSQRSINGSQIRRR